MSHVFQIPDEMYSKIARYAAQRGQTPDALIMLLLAKGMEALKPVQSTTSIQKTSGDPSAPFIRAFDNANDNSGWIEQHDADLAGNHEVSNGDIEDRENVKSATTLQTDRETPSTTTKTLFELAEFAEKLGVKGPKDLSTNHDKYLWDE